MKVFLSRFVRGSREGVVKSSVNVRSARRRVERGVLLDSVSVAGRFGSHTIR